MSPNSRKILGIATFATSFRYVNTSLMHSCVHSLQDYEGEPGDVRQGREYFKKRFLRLGRVPGKEKEREIYVQLVNIFSRLES